jgi:hypothetical protein
MAPPRHQAAAAPPSFGAARPPVIGNRPFRDHTVQPMSAISGAIGRLWDRFMGFDALAQSVREGFAEGLESIDHYLYSRDGLAENSHQGDQFRDEWQRFTASGEGGIHCHQTDPNGFRARIMSREGFIWALTEEGRLVVGTSSGVVNHSILARGSRVLGAGEGTLRLTETEIRWLNWTRLRAYERQGVFSGLRDRDGTYASFIRLGGNDPRFFMKGNSDELQEYLDLRAMNLTEPPPRRTGTVVLDFGSGHYRPKSGWRQVLNAWQDAGFFAVVDENSRFK